ncbi:hypothetical protein [uncultured Polaribacter sp.]|uniref:hypothetical protein n=1 Tax=uncultured Polaribacter sp. TaxID=174711 RepID=UPI002627EF7A|nr:hypothetical protein [uncultured Polaribacter sp.]
MKLKLYKKIPTLLAICFLGGTVFAQKFNENFTENFKVNKDVEVVINASNSEINVTTWNKNEVQINAFIEIEGLSQKEATTYFKKWNFEALGNKSKVKITSKGSGLSGLKNDFVFFNDFDFPEIEMPNIEAIVLPDMDFDFDFDFDFESLEDLEEDMERDGKYAFEYHKDGEHIIIKTKKEWEKFKKSKKYEDLKKEFKNSSGKLKIALENSKEKMKHINKERLKKSLEKAKLQIKSIDKEQMRRELAKAKELLKNMNFNFYSDENDLMINGKKIKIKKRLEIKVPKGATFNLNTRHCKVKLPNTVASGNVKYGSFDANNLNGGKLTINYSPVSINSLNACTLFLNNVTDAKIASVTNTTLSNNSSDVNILSINKNVHISDQFGELTIESFHPNFEEFVLNLSQSNAIMVLDKVKTSFHYNINRSKLDNKSSFDFLNKVFKKYEMSSKSEVINSQTKNMINLNSDLSTIIIK